MEYRTNGHLKKRDMVEVFDHMIKNRLESCDYDGEHFDLVYTEHYGWAYGRLMLEHLDKTMTLDDGTDAYNVTRLFVSTDLKRVEYDCVTHFKKYEGVLSDGGAFDHLYEQ